MDAKLHNSRNYLFFCFKFLLSIGIFSLHLFGAIGVTYAKCGGTDSSYDISMINVHASSDASEQSNVPGEFILTRSSDLSKRIKVPFGLSDSAKNNVDFKRIYGRVFFEIGEFEKSVTIEPIDDAEVEGDEAITLILKPGIGYMLGSKISDTIILIDNDTNSPVDGSTQLPIIKGSRKDSASVKAHVASIDATQSIQFSGEGEKCKMNRIRWLNPVSSQLLPKPPANTKYIPGFYFANYQVSQCVPGSTLSFTLNYKQTILAGAKLMQYGKTPVKASDHWHEIRNTKITGNEVTYTVTDGQVGDKDLLVNGSVTNLVVLLVPKQVQVALQ